MLPGAAGTEGISESVVGASPAGGGHVPNQAGTSQNLCFQGAGRSDAAKAPKAFGGAREIFHQGAYNERDGRVCTVPCRMLTYDP